ncbi:Zinc finger, C2HC5-type protein [Ceratobasidium theobromae]|uniref:Zinc finger, C2HC5-type protein n=1 Tax=Ceratobasidium theobromae TaxID=1582974 RepID=A0A5N5QQ85_9AGAM|nr:Zinc finger, C2HC5-type protein [Ceratobasidium theobromae]
MSKKSASSTAWATTGKGRRDGGSLTSELLAPRRQSPAPVQNQPKRSKGQSSPANSELLKSHEVRKLEKLIDEVSTGIVDSRAASRPGCFCMARTHPLSRYVPLCNHCGIVLCSLLNPALPCPSCSSPLLPPVVRNALLLQLQGELAAQLTREAEKRTEDMKALAEIELAKSGGGHFPTLTGQSDPRSSQVAVPRKVLSVNSTTKKATISTFLAVPTPPTSNPNSGRGSPVDEKIPAPEQTPYVVPLDPERQLLLRQRPWVDLLDPTPIYQAEYHSPQPAEGKAPSSSGKRGRGRGKKGQNNDRNDAEHGAPGASSSQNN